MQAPLRASEVLGLNVPAEALVPYLDMIATWLKLKLQEAGHSAKQKNMRLP